MKEEYNENRKKPFLVKIGDFIVNFRNLFLIIFIGLTIFCAFNIKNVDINDSIVSYLPSDTETKQGLDIMESVFGKQSTIKLMVSDITLENAKELVGELSKLSSVQAVLFDEKSSYKDNSALYTIQANDLSEEQVSKLKEDIESTVKSQEYYLTSEEFESSTDGINKVLIIACLVIIIILLITSKTYFEPIIAFIIFGISIILNMGSNFLLGEISYITQSIAVILQLALSIDYVIIFMNQFMKEINDTSDKTLAIKKTVSKSIPEIFASSLTTISGLLALCFMQLKIGGDIGIVLSKGILCSLLTVILVMPSLLYLFSNIILKWQKKLSIKIKQTN